MTQQLSVEKVKEMLDESHKSSHDSAVEKQKSDGYIILKRGFATIPLPGIDVAAVVAGVRGAVCKLIDRSETRRTVLPRRYTQSRPCDMSRPCADGLHQAPRR